MRAVSLCKFWREKISSGTRGNGTNETSVQRDTFYLQHRSNAERTSATRTTTHKSNAHDHMPRLRGDKNLLLITLLLFFLVVRHVEELDFEASLRCRNNTQPVTKLSTLQELLCQVLEVALRERNRRLDPDLALTLCLLYTSDAADE